MLPPRYGRVLGQLLPVFLPLLPTVTIIAGSFPQISLSQGGVGQ